VSLLRIGVDASCWANGRGYGRFTREILRLLPTLASADEFVCFVDPVVAEQFDLKRDNVRLVRVEQSVAPSRAASAEGYRSVPDMLRFSRAVSRARLDVFFSPSVYTYFPLPPGLPAVVTVHDAIAERFPRLTLPSRRAELFWRAKVKLAIWQAKLVLTVSEYSARDLTTVLKVAPRRVRVATEAPSAAYRPSESAVVIAAAKARIGLPKDARYFVYVGGFNPHKRLDVVVKAHAALAAELGAAAPHLVLVGAADRDGFHKDLASLHHEIDAAGAKHLVHWPGFLSDEELRHIHSGSLGLVLVSECEGFGLPAVEAAACGTAVVATVESPLPQLLAGGGFFVRPGDENALLNALRQLATDEPNRLLMAGRARERANALTWPRSAHAVLAALREAGNDVRPVPVARGRRALQSVEIAG